MRFQTQIIAMITRQLCALFGRKIVFVQTKRKRPIRTLKSAKSAFCKTYIRRHMAERHLDRRAVKEHFAIWKMLIFSMLQDHLSISEMLILICFLSGFIKGLLQKLLKMKMLCSVFSRAANTPQERSGIWNTTMRATSMIWNWVNDGSSILSSD